MHSPLFVPLRLFVVAACGAVLTASAQTPVAPAAQEWGHVTALSGMTRARAAHQATLLRSGEVLVSGGCTPGCEGAVATSEVFNPTTRTFTVAGELRTPRISHSANLLADGRVFIAGGWAGASTTSTTEIYDPATRRFTPGPSLSTRRAGAASLVLPDGRVLISGGEADIDDVASSIDVFDPVSGTLSVLGRMSVPRALHTATLLRDGRVLLAGGRRGRRQELRGAEIFDPRTRQSQVVGEMAVARHKHAAVALKDGRVMVIGGSRTSSGRDELHATTELYDVSRQTFSAGPTLAFPRHKIPDAVAVLASGDVVVAGGAVQMERWTPGAPGFVPVAGSTGARAEFATANLLPDGSVLVLGGYGEGIRPFTTARVLVPR